MTSSSLFTNAFSSMNSHMSGEPRSHSTPLLLSPNSSSDTIGNLHTTPVTHSTTASITASPRSVSISEETELPLSTKSLVTSGQNKLHSSAKPSIHALVSDLLTSSAIPTSGHRGRVSYKTVSYCFACFIGPVFPLPTHTHSQDDNGNIMTIIITATSVSGVILIITIGTEVILHGYLSSA